MREITTKLNKKIDDLKVQDLLKDSIHPVLKKLGLIKTTAKGEAERNKTIRELESIFGERTR